MKPKTKNTSPKPNNARRHTGLINLFKQPVTWLLLAGLVVLVLSLWVGFKLRPFNSDDVSAQVAIATWQPFQGEKLFYTDDTWLLKLPLYGLLESWLGPARSTLFITCVLLAAAAYTLVYIVLAYFGRRAGAGVSKGWTHLTAFIWLCSLGSTFTTLLLNPNLRNIEIGVSFMTFLLLAALYYKRIDVRRSRRWLLLTISMSLLVGLTVYNDPMFLFLLVLPLGLLTVFTANKVPRHQTVTTLLFLIGAALTYKLIALIGQAAGYVLYHQSISFVGYSELFPQLAVALQALLQVFSADFTGRPVLDIETFSRLLNAGVLAGAQYWTVRNLRELLAAKRRASQTIIWSGFFGGLFVFIFAVYALSSLVVNVETYRYLVLLPFLAVALWSGGMLRVERPTKRILTGLLLLTAGLNLYVSFQSLRPAQAAIAGPNRANYQNFELLKALQKEDLPKGYGQYWDSHINTYLSDYKTTVAPVICQGGQTKWFDWLTRNDLLRGDPDGKRSFMLRNSNPGTGTAIPTCEPDALERQFGKPERTVEVQGYTAYVYNYDIGTHIPERSLKYGDE